MSNPPDINWNNLSQVQAEITRWASERFPHRTDHHAIYKLMVEEIPELAIHKKEKGVGTIGTELADCFILLLDLASLWNVDIAQAIWDKMRINYARQWNMDINGIMQHVPVQDDSQAREMVLKSVKCPQCDGDTIETTPSSAINLYRCTACEFEFDDDIPF